MIFSIATMHVPGLALFVAIDLDEGFKNEHIKVLLAYVKTHPYLIELDTKEKLLKQLCYSFSMRDP